MRVTKWDYILMVLLILLPIALFGGIVAGINGLVELSILCSIYIAAALVVISIKCRIENTVLGRTITAWVVYALMAAAPVLSLIFF